MDYVRSFKAFINEEDGESKVVATVVANEGKIVVECAGEKKYVTVSETNEESKSVLEKICECAQSMGATHLFNKSSNPQVMPITEILHYIMRGTKKGLFQGQDSHAGFWDIVQGKKPSGLN